MPLATADFGFIKTLLQTSAGNVLESQRDYMVETRLQGVAEKVGLRSVQALINKMRDGGNESLIRVVVESLVNNETMFFRDITPFDIMREKVLPEMIQSQRQDRTLNIWSAASSSGQEPYSIAMLLLENFPSLMDWQVRILGTDCSQNILSRAQQGKYSQIEVNRGLPARYLVKYFERVGVSWQLKGPVRQMVNFSEVNLVTMWPPLPRMDVIFMRNVLIYFDVETKREVLAQVERQLRPGGYLFLGAAETTINLSAAFERRFDKAACYQLRPRQEGTRVL